MYQIYHYNIRRGWQPLPEQYETEEIAEVALNEILGPDATAGDWYSYEIREAN
jgi:hypothetical protein